MSIAVVQENQSLAVDSSGTETITGLSWLAGQTVVVMGMTEDNANSGINLPTVAGLTFAPMPGSPTNTASSCKGYVWSAVAGSSGSGSIVATATGGGVGHVIEGWVLPVGVALGTPVLTIGTGKTLALTRVGQDSLILFLAGDYSANSDTTVTADPVGGTQRIAEQFANYAVFAFDWSATGAPGTTNYGVGNASGTGVWTKLALEIIDPSVSTPTLQYKSFGTAGVSAASGTSVSPNNPSGTTAQDFLIAVVGQRPTTANGGTCATPSGWTPCGTNLAQGGYGATLGADTGNTNLYFFYKVATGSESGTLAITIGDNDVAWAYVINFGPTFPAGSTPTYSVAHAAGSDTSAGSVSAAMGTDPGFIVGDIALMVMCIPTDVSTPLQFSNEAITASGATFDTAVELAEPDSATGNDIGGWLAASRVTAGASSGVPTVTATATGTTTNVRGPVSVLRIRMEFPSSTTEFEGWGIAA